jgi:hypothetical protein
MNAFVLSEEFDVVVNNVDLYSGDTRFEFRPGKGKR